MLPNRASWIAAAKVEANFDAARLRTMIKPTLLERLRSSAVRALLTAYLAACRAFAALGRSKRPAAPDGCDVLLTGTFHSRNWVAAHLGPLAASSRCARVRVVTSVPLPPIEKVEALAPPPSLEWLLGPVGARLAYFAWMALRTRPHVVGGYHLLVNGLAAILVGRIAGARSLYICTGGRTEVLDGGVWGENRLFGRLAAPQPGIERQLVGAVNAADGVIVKGPRAAAFMRQRGVRVPMHFMTGAIEWRRYSPQAVPRDFDLVLVGRLVQVKRVDVFLRTVRLLCDRRPQTRAVIVGDGPLRGELERLANDLQIAAAVHFAGHQEDVASWLHRGRVFVLTSDSESLALSLMEATMCGVPSVVSDVGDLAALVHEGVNGYLIRDRTPEQFASCLSRLLQDEPRLARLRAETRRASLHLRVDAVGRKWDVILDALVTQGIVPAGVRSLA
jgi:L-malate glycosyltransferase